MPKTRGVTPASFIPVETPSDLAGRTSCSGQPDHRERSAKALPLVSFGMLVIATIFFFLDQPALASDQHEWDLLELTTGPSG